ncbi:hypothetical protein FACS1894116_00620 [Betaproteobacteria bacterium]|nr:hypothetical protein FACS1894116_00620 [Betaproteobacteria bacterium]GHU28395.1 hypothetical protein FACS189497_03760 [Betaproteobacteria bacterium]
MQNSLLELAKQSRSLSRSQPNLLNEHGSIDITSWVTEHLKLRKGDSVLTAIDTLSSNCFSVSDVFAERDGRHFIFAYHLVPPKHLDDEWKVELANINHYGVKISMSLDHNTKEITSIVGRVFPFSKG